MKKRMIALLLLVALSLTLFAACGKKATAITTEEAQKIALKEVGMTADQVDDIHVHATQYEGTPCYQMHITAGNAVYYVYIDQTGKVLHTNK